MLMLYKNEGVLILTNKKECNINLDKTNTKVPCFLSLGMFKKYPNQTYNQDKKATNFNGVINKQSLIISFFSSLTKPKFMPEN